MNAKQYDVDSAKPWNEQNKKQTVIASMKRSIKPTYTLCVDYHYIRQRLCHKVRQ